MNTLLFAALAVPMLAAVSGGSLINAVILVIIVGVVAGLLWWLISYVALPQPFDKVARVLVAIVVVIFLINALLSLVGRPFITW